MEIRLESEDGILVGSPTESIDDFAAKTNACQREWVDRVSKTPDAFCEVEQEISQHYQLGAGRLVASLLAEATVQPAMAETVEQIQEHAVVAVKRPQERPLRIRLLCGLVLLITTSYCAPRGRKSRRQGKEERAGLYPELAALGFSKGCSPALQYAVARIVALSPSIDVARRELARQGIRLDKKAVRRIAERVGREMLALRYRELVVWHAGLLPAGKALAGRRVVVQIDGGRVRLRENLKSPRRKGKRPRFTTPWREPKVLTIFEIDEHGKMTKKHHKPLIEGTLLGPDHLAELVACRLHQLGAAQAEQVIFVSDGAHWIWDRLDWIEQAAGLDPSRTVHVLDFCHASHHISLALKALNLEDPHKREQYRQMRHLLKRSRYDEVVAQLRDLAECEPTDADVWTEIRYLERHGTQGHLNYATFRRRGIPLGSGAVESAIRRVINQRLKSNAIYWLQENAEAMFAVRATLLCNRWETTLARVRKVMATDRRLTWQWEAENTVRPNADATVDHMQTEVHIPQCSTTIAA